MRVQPLVVVLAIALLAFLCQTSLGAYQTTTLYQGTTCSGNPINVNTQIVSQCNVTTVCQAYSGDPTNLSQTISCPSSFPSQANVAGQIYINTYSDSTCSAQNLQSYNVYATNVCMKSNVIFGPGAQSAQYIGCGKQVLYSDSNCQTVLESTTVTLNTCANNAITRCGNAVSQTVTYAALVIVALMTILFL